jgi:hypothetical protein
MIIDSIFIQNLLLDYFIFGACEKTKNLQKF